jgi:RNA polymerase sigma-70 factor (ECF subfamily)
MASGQPTSLTLLERLRTHEPGAWERLLYLYTPLVAYWCKRGGVRGQDADDVSQEVFQSVAAGLGGFRRDRAGDTFRGWLRAITRNKVRDHFRRGQHQPEARGGTDAQKRLQEISQPETPLPDEADDPPQELTGLYHRALELIRSEFEGRTWQAFWRAAVEGQAPADIAADLGVTPAAVRKAKSRVLRRLREEVGDLIA